MYGQSMQTHFLIITTILLYQLNMYYMTFVHIPVYVAARFGVILCPVILKNKNDCLCCAVHFVICSQSTQI